MSAPKRRFGKTVEQWDRMCLGKRRYADEFAARASAQNSINNASFNVRGFPHMWVYPCPSCRGWHVTTKATKYDAVSATDLYVSREGIRAYYRELGSREASQVGKVSPDPLELQRAARVVEVGVIDPIHHDAAVLGLRSHGGAGGG